MVSIKTLINNLCQGLNSNSIIISLYNFFVPCHVTGHGLDLLGKIKIKGECDLVELGGVHDV